MLTFSANKHQISQCLVLKLFSWCKKTCDFAGTRYNKKYVNFVGKTLWESLSESSNTAGDKFLSGMYGLFGVASRRGNEVFLLSNMTNDEFAKGVISIERLGQLRKAMGEYRVVEGRNLSLANRLRSNRRAI